MAIFREPQTLRIYGTEKIAYKKIPPPEKISVGGKISQEEVRRLREKQREVRVNGKTIMLNGEVVIREGGKERRIDISSRIGGRGVLRDAEFAANKYEAYVAVNGRLYSIELRSGKVVEERLEDIERKEGGMPKNLRICAGEKHVFVIGDGSHFIYALSSVEPTLGFIPIKTIWGEEGGISSPSMAFLNNFVFITGNGRNGRAFRNLYMVDVSRLGPESMTPVIIHGIPFFDEMGGRNPIIRVKDGKLYLSAEGWKHVYVFDPNLNFVEKLKIE